jgi:acyl transferase domain-containing protein/acyl carrier protein
MATQVTATSSEQIAVIGMTGRYPSAKNLEEFWSNLKSEKDCITFFTDEELLEAGIEPETLSDPNYVKARGTYEDTYMFDAHLFGYTPREAELIDPQQRVLLECALEAAEIAGYDPSTYSGRMGLFAGSGATQYLFQLIANNTILRTIGGLALITSNDKDYLTTRVGYKLNLRGPCVTVQTACSTSLVATVLACQSLLNYQCDVALAGGCTLAITERGGYFYEEGGIVSPDGKCRTFDASGKGTIFSCGAGIVVLKRLEEALRDRDTIYAVVRGVGMNNDGAARVGFSAPGVEGQAAVSAEAIAMAGIDPETIGLVECHGTATAMGDPIEIAALTRTFRSYTDKKQFCAVGSVKTNIGHTDAASGVAGFTKAVLALKNKTIPASLHFEKPNPQLDFKNSPFYVSTRTTEWKRDQTPRRASVNAFGIGGTNAHVILEEAPEAEPSSQSRPHQLLVWSAKTNTALDAMSSNLLAHLKAHPEQSLADIAFTLQTGRKLFANRRALVCRNHQDAIEALEDTTGGRMLTLVQEKQDRPVCFLFPGQGAQYANMGRELYDNEPAFRATVDRCAELLTPHLGLDLRTLLFPAEDQLEHANEQLRLTAFTQPALFVIEYAVARLLMDSGVRPRAMMGHSIGEYVAACLASVLSLEDALRLVAGRGRLMQQLPEGSMLGVLLAERDMAAFLNGIPNLSVAAVNSPATCVVSGPTDAIERLESAAGAKGIPCRRLHTSHAFHSAMMDPILEPFRALVQTVRLNAPAIPYVSNLTGTWITAAQCTQAEYWVNHLRHAVRFADGAAELLNDASNVLVEVGPGRTLTSLLGQHPAKTAESAALSTLPHAGDEQRSDMQSMFIALGRLWMEGVSIDWKEFYSKEKRQRIPVPTYPFERQRYRIELPADDNTRKADISKKKKNVADWFLYPSWKRGVLPAAKLEPQPDSCWLLFMDECGLAADLAHQLQAEQYEVIMVTPGDTFECARPNSYTVAVGNRDHYAALMKELRSLGKTPTNIVHLWGVTQPTAPHDEIECSDSMLEQTFYSLLFLAQSLGTQYPTTRIYVHVVTNDTHDVNGDEVVCPTKATVFGPCKAMPREYRDLLARIIDVHIPEGPSARAALASVLLAEFRADTKDEMVAYRGGYRWVPGLESFQVADPGQGTPGLREQGVYVITGGLGGISLALAEYLAGNLHAKLALIGRTALPDRQQWPQLLETADPESSVCSRIRAVLKLENLGAEVLTFAADVCDAARMNEVLKQVRQRFGRIHGVIHAAGVAGKGIMELKTREAANEVLAPKVKGTLILEKLLQQDDLDFFMLCSSLTAITGAGGQVDYTAGNAFLDSFSYSRKHAPKNVPISVNWDRWDDVGMALIKVPDADTPPPVDDNFEPFVHPIFSRCLRTAEQQIYAALLHPADHWVVGEHQLAGRPTLVGTAYLELVRTAYTGGHDQPVEIKDVVFMGPLVMGEQERRHLQVVLTPTANSSDFQVRSSTDGISWSTHAMGKIGPGQASTRPNQPIENLLNRCSQSGQNGSLVDGGGFIQFSPRWDNLKAVAIGNGEAVATIELPPQFSTDLESFPLHPAMLDTATAFAIQYVSNGQMYLPFAYNKLKIHKSLPQKFYSHAKFQSPNGSGAEEFVSFDLLMVDERGDILIEIEGYGLRRVDESSWKASAASANPSELPQVKVGISRDKAGDRILSHEGVQVFQRVLALSTMPQVAVAAKDFGYLLTEGRPIREQLAEQEAKASNTSGLKGGHPRPNLPTPYVAPRSELELAVATIWESVLGIEQLGVNDSFVELGGHSLMAIQLAARVREVFEIEMSVASLYKKPTVAGLAAAIIEMLVSQADTETIAHALEELEDSPKSAAAVAATA